MPKYIKSFLLASFFGILVESPLHAAENDRNNNDNYHLVFQDGARKVVYYHSFNKNSIENKNIHDIYGMTKEHIIRALKKKVNDSKQKKKHYLQYIKEESRNKDSNNLTLDDLVELDIFWSKSKWKQTLLDTKRSLSDQITLPKNSNELIYFKVIPAEKDSIIARLKSLSAKNVLFIAIVGFIVLVVVGVGSKLIRACYQKKKSSSSFTDQDEREYYTEQDDIEYNEEY